MVDHNTRVDLDGEKEEADFEVRRDRNLVILAREKM